MSLKNNDPSNIVKIDFLNVISKSFWLFFDNMGLFLVASFFWVLLSFPLVTCPAATASIIFLADELSFGKEMHIKDFFRAFKKYFLRSTGGAIFMAVIIALSALGLIFYSSRLGLTGRIIAIIMGVVIILSNIGLVYIFPLAFRIRKPLKVVKSALTLSVCHPVFTFGIFLYVGTLFVLGLVSGLGIIFVTPGLSAAAISSAMRELSYKYGFSDSPKKENKTLKGTFMPWTE